jgi:hypothetical protein
MKNTCIAESLKNNHGDPDWEWIRERIEHHNA